MNVQSIKDRQSVHRLGRTRFLCGGVALLLCVLALLLNGCGSLFQTPARSGTPQGGAITFSTPTAAVSPTASTAAPQTISLQVIGCPSTLSLNWDKLVGTQANVNKVQKVICGSLEGAGTLEALIDVRYYAGHARLDFAVCWALTRSTASC